MVSLSDPSVNKDHALDACDQNEGLTGGLHTMINLFKDLHLALLEPMGYQGQYLASKIFICRFFRGTRNVLVYSLYNLFRFFLALAR